MRTASRAFNVIRTAAFVVVAVALVAGPATACRPKKGSSGCVFARPKIITVGLVAAPGPAVGQPEELPMPRPKPPKTPKSKETKERKKNCDKQNSPVWNGYSNARHSWKTDGTYYYKWDKLHNDIEKYDKRGRHQGSVDPATGKAYRSRQPGHDLTKTERDW